MSTYPLIGLVYTRTCPLACGHCITESSPQARGRMGPEQVRRYLPAIRRFTGHVSFTGGEPLLHYREIAALTREARQLGLAVSVVTGAGWVKDDAMARARVQALAAAGVSRLVVSWDAYHEAFAPRASVLAVARAAGDAGLAVDVRAVVPATAPLEEYHAPFRPLPVRLESTRPIRLGSARALPDDAFSWSESPPKGVCAIVLRPAIEPDGTVYACCGPGRFSGRPSPLVLGNAEDTPLEEILARAAGDPILQAIGLIGPHGLYRLLDSHPTTRPAPRRRYAGVCELCLDLNGSADAVAALRTCLVQTDTRILLAAAQLWAERPPPAADVRGPAA